MLRSYLLIGASALLFSACENTSTPDNHDDENGDQNEETIPSDDSKSNDDNNELTKGYKL